MKSLSALAISGLIALLPFATHAADSHVTSISTLLFDDTTTGAATHFTYDFHVADAIDAGSIVTAKFFDADGNFVDDFGFSSATADIDGWAGISNDLDGTILSDGFAGSIDQSGFSNTDFQVDLYNVTNPAGTGFYRLGVTSSADTTDPSGYTLSDVFTFGDTTFPINQLSIGHVTAHSALLKWSVVTLPLAPADCTVYYNVKLFTRTGKKIKTFRHVTSHRKLITRTSRLIKPGRNYRFKVRAYVYNSNNTYTGAWSTWEYFSTPAAQ